MRPLRYLFLVVSMILAYVWLPNAQVAWLIDILNKDIVGCDAPAICAQRGLALFFWMWSGILLAVCVAIAVMTVRRLVDAQLPMSLVLVMIVLLLIQTGVIGSSFPWVHGLARETLGVPINQRELLGLLLTLALAYALFDREAPGWVNVVVCLIIWDTITTTLSLSAGSVGALARTLTWLNPLDGIQTNITSTVLLGLMTSAKPLPFIVLVLVPKAVPIGIGLTAMALRVPAMARRRADAIPQPSQQVR